MNRKQFAKYLERDGHCVCGCGSMETLVPQHRANRGHGGSKLLDRPSNVIVLCSGMNGDIESLPHLARKARLYGWKLQRWQTPEDEPFFDVITQSWWLIDNEYNRVPHGGPRAVDS